ncbi:MAG: B3/4 domain-containing protein [Bdellovibrionales bacterium]
MTDKKFHISSDVLDLGVRVCGAFAFGLDNSTRHPDLEAWLNQKWDHILSTLPSLDMEKDDVLRGFRTLHAGLGKTGKRWASSPENMIGNLQRFGRIPSINPIVDIYNALSCESHLALGAHDLAFVNGDISLRLLSGSESFLPLGSKNMDKVQKGEYGYCDDGNDVLCRLEIRQVEKTKVTAATQDCFFIIQGHEWMREDLISQTVDALGKALVHFCGGRFSMVQQDCRSP